MGAVLLPSCEFHQKTTNKVNAIHEIEIFSFSRRFFTKNRMKVVNSIVRVSLFIYLYQICRRFDQNLKKFKLNCALHHTYDLNQSNQSLNIWEKRVENIDFSAPDRRQFCAGSFYGQESLPSSSDCLEIVSPISQITTYSNEKWPFLMTGQKFPDQFLKWFLESSA